MTAVLALAACTQQTPAGASPSAAASAAAKRGAGGDLKILYWQAPTILNRHQATGTKDADASRLITEPLASFGKDGLPVANGLAAEIPTAANGGVSADFTTVTWKLRTGVKWSDGTPFTADDVVATFTYQCDEKSAASTIDRCEGVKSVTAKDANTAVVTYKEPQPFYYQWGVGDAGTILQKAQYANCLGAKAKDCAADQKPIGTGPYKVREFKAGDVVTYDLNENFRDPNKPFFKSVTFKGGGDATSAARAAFQTGDVDYAWNLQVELKSVPAGTFFTNTSPGGANHFWSDVEMFTNSGDPDPTSYFVGWTTKQMTGKANNWQFGNYHRYSNPDLDAVVDSLRKETDQKKRNDLAIKANDILVSDVVVIPLINRTFATSGVSKSLKGVDPTPWDSEMWNIADWTK